MNSLTRGELIKGLTQIDFVTLVVNQGRARHFLRDMAQERFGEVHLIAVRPVRRVELHHREFRIVADRNTFVAEVAV